MDYQTLNWDDIEWEVIRKGVKRKVFHSEKTTVVLNHLEPNIEPNLHSHPHEQVAYIESGECDFGVGDKVFHIKAGGMLTIPGNVKHYLKVCGDKTVVDIDIFVPRREDYKTILK